MVLNAKILYPLILDSSNSNTINSFPGIQIREVSLYIKQREQYLGMLRWRGHFQYNLYVLVYCLSIFDLALYMYSCIEIITYSENIILHDLQLNRGLRALRNNNDTDM